VTLATDDRRRVHAQVFLRASKNARLRARVRGLKDSIGESAARGDIGKILDDVALSYNACNFEAAGALLDFLGDIAHNVRLEKDGAKSRWTRCPRAPVRTTSRSSNL